MSEKIRDKKVYTTSNINAVSINHYNLCLNKDERIVSEQLQELQYDKLERNEQELLMGILVEGKVTLTQDNDNTERLKAEVDMLDLINFLGLTPGGKRYRKLREILERLKTREVTKIVTKEENNKRVIHSIAKGVIISDFELYKKTDNKLYKLTEFEQFRRIAIKLYFSKTFSEVLLHDSGVGFFLKDKHIIKAIQKQPTYVRDVINYIIPIMGDKELSINEVMKDIYGNAETAKKTKQRLMKAYQENEDVRDLFLFSGLKIDVQDGKIIKRMKGLKDKNGKKVDPIFFMLGKA